MVVSDIKRLAAAVLNTEAREILRLAKNIDDNFVLACSIMLACEGRIVVTGMGKSGYISGKLAATLASTGTPAFYVHPGEASHGDLGMIIPKDVVVAISNSGETDEILIILPLIKRQNVPLIALTGNPNSTLAKNASVHINVAVEKEACPLGLAPTSSTTAALAMGDALAISLLESRGFTAEDFARSHPGGRLGRRLLLLVKDLMHEGNAIPSVTQDTPMSRTLLEMTEKGLGMTSVVDQNNKLLGIFTDGDLRRLLDHGQVDLHNTSVADFMVRNCKVGYVDWLAAEALQVMQKHRINALLIVNSAEQVVGALNMHDLLKAGVV